MAHPQRTDLNTPKPLPPTAVPGQPYGEAGKQLAAQTAVPMSPLPVAPAAPAQAVPQQPMGPAPGELPGLLDPSGRPDEPLTHGLPFGPGAGPEIFAPPPSPVLKGLALLNVLGDDLPASLRAVRDALNVNQAQQAPQ